MDGHLYRALQSRDRRYDGRVFYGVKTTPVRKENSMSRFYDKINSPIGELTLIASDEALVALLWEKDKGMRKFASAKPAARHPILLRAKSQLKEYFDGCRTTFDLPIDLHGTPFQVRVWKTLQTIPYGKTLSYSEQAALVGDRKKARAVGGANGKNPISIIVPCHRVIGKNGKLTGFGGGLESKEYLLKLEQRN